MRRLALLIGNVSELLDLASQASAATTTLVSMVGRVERVMGVLKRASGGWVADRGAGVGEHGAALWVLTRWPTIAAPALTRRPRTRGARRVVVLALLFLLVLGVGAAVGDPQGQLTKFTSGLNASSNVIWIAPGTDGSLWFTDDGTTKAIGHITLSGEIIEYQDNADPAFSPYAITPGPDGNEWFTDPGTKAIGRITPSGQITEYPDNMYPNANPHAMTLGADGNLWFTDPACYYTGGTCVIGRVTPSGQITPFPLNAGINPNGIAAGPDGNVWFTDRGTTSEIGRVTPSGQITYFSVNLNTGSQLWYLAPGPDGNVWFTDRGTTGAIGRITPSGAIQEFNLGAGDAPLGIAPGPDGNVWFTDTGGHAIGRVTPSGQITEFSSNLLSSSYTWSIAPGADGNLWFTDDGTGAIWRVGAGAPAAEAAVPIVSGSGQAGSVQTCVAGPWATWAGFAPSTGLFPFDGYTWLRDGAVVGGQSGQNYVPAAGDVGHQLACEVRATYPAPFLVTAQTTSAPVVVHGASSPSPVAVLPPIARLGASSSLGATASIPFTCSGTPGQVCREGVVGTSRERKQRHSIIAVVASRESERAGDRALRTVTVTVVSASFSLAAGGAALEQVTLNDVGKQLLARFHTLPVRLTFAGAVTAVEDVVFSRALPRIRVSLPPDDWFHTFAPCGDCYSYAMHVPVTGLTPTMRISVSCAGQGCPFSRRNVTPRTRTVDIARVLANSHLLPGTKVSVAITARGRTGEAVTYTMQKGSGPVRTILCLAGGSDRPLPCGS